MCRRRVVTISRAPLKFVSIANTMTRADCGPVKPCPVASSEGRSIITLTWSMADASAPNATA